ncbi:MAG: phosphoribosylanthranilate isomerase [Gammaproteobacteria bacterium]|nr:phosphoribosylanthranilate isomerase [Gammaproteobacteria bacterium]MDH3369891.1 phosphoribosylanthranilate isomerase [Gammaproteobacteria bacterium]MDH3407156.1 phosphoribosylanthranilate isomerase [Gammaproteobacteria bacterium]MDH3561938.1 phosphoribosylanthranilate isomerase [Gammaproteobacteria bacterium]MDH5486720.1 phosphoribosylanthranilate isomerase [Gammaproteobacteria bacterium]
MRTRVKICGITRTEDALAAAQAGADAIGLVFEPKSPRGVKPEQALIITRALPPFVTVVGLFVNAAFDTVETVLKRVPLDLLQFHGDETPEQCRRYHRPYIKAIHMRDKVNLPDQARRYSDAEGLLLDTATADIAGGSGQVFDWNRVTANLGKPVILAGGLTPENVGEAVRTVRPFAVDVSSGVEQSKGIKDAQKISAFIEAVRKATA